MNPLAIAIAVYLGAHLFRMVRMAVLLGESARSLRAVVLAQAITAPAGLLPFKMGELARIMAIGRATRGVAHGGVAVWIERTYDAAALVVASIVALLILGDSGGFVWPVALLAGGFLAMTTLAIVVWPEQMTMAKGWLIRRYSTPWSLVALRVLHQIGAELRSVRGLVRNKTATLALLTAAVWALEALALWMLVPSGRGVWSAILGAQSQIVSPGSSDGLALHRTAVVAGVVILGSTGLALAAVRTALVRTQLAGSR